MSEKGKKVLILGILTPFWVVTLAPLILMFYGSVKPGGTLGKPLRQIIVRVPADEGVSSIPLRLDMRKFTVLNFSVKGRDGGETLWVGLRDIFGNETKVAVHEILRGGVSREWQRVSLPVPRFDLSTLHPTVPEKIAEELFWFSEEREKVFLDEVRLVLKRFTLANYIDVVVSGSFGRYFFNSLLIAVVVVLGNLLFASMVGYAFARKTFPGKEFLFILVLGSIMIPPQVFMVPIFILMKNFGWLNTYWALTVPSLVIPFNVFFMRQYISALPTSLEDAARIDGAGDFQIFFRIVLPLSKPALAVVGIHTFIGSWNTFLYPFLLTNTADMRTLPVGLALYKQLQGVDWVHLLAGSSLTALPVIAIFLFFQRYILAGITASVGRKR